MKTRLFEYKMSGDSVKALHESGMVPLAGSKK
jgi:hypothetical protein